MMPAIPWATALYVFKKIMPVVIDQAPELIKTFERRRTAPPAPTATDDAVTALREQLESQSQVLTAQSETLVRLQTALVTIRRSLFITWIVIGIMAALSLALLLGLFLRP